jgi:hypothetical protein
MPDHSKSQELKAEWKPIVACSFPRATEINVTAFTLISLRLGPPKIANTGLHQGLGLQLLEKLSVSGSFIKDLEHFVITLRKPSNTKIVYPKTFRPPEFLIHVQWRETADPDSIKSEDADAEFLRNAWDLVGLAEGVEEDLTEQVYSMDPSEMNDICQCLDTSWGRPSTVGHSTRPYLPDLEFDWN